MEEASTKWKLFTISALLRTWFDPLWLILWLWWTKASALLFYEWSISTLVTTFEKTIKHIDRFACTELLRNRVNIQYFLMKLFDLSRIISSEFSDSTKFISSTLVELSNMRDNFQTSSSFEVFKGQSDCTDIKDKNSFILWSVLTASRQPWSKYWRIEKKTDDNVLPSVFVLYILGN